MPTYSFPVLAAVLLGVVQAVMLLFLLLRLPKLEPSRPKRFLRIALLFGPLLGFLVLLDYGQWQEDFATRGMQRRAHSVTAYLDHVAQALSRQDYTPRTAEVALIAAREQYFNLSALLVEDDGIALPAFEFPPEFQPGPQVKVDAEARLRHYLNETRLLALRSQLLLDEPSRGPMVYLRDRILR
jgi:hypothetical protein